MAERRQRASLEASLGEARCSLAQVMTNYGYTCYTYYAARVRPTQLDFLYSTKYVALLTAQEREAVQLLEGSHRQLAALLRAPTAPPPPPTPTPAPMRTFDAASPAGYHPSLVPRRTAARTAVAPPTAPPIYMGGVGGGGYAGSNPNPNPNPNP